MPEASPGRRQAERRGSARRGCPEVPAPPPPGGRAPLALQGRGGAGAGAGAVLREASGCLPGVLATSGRAPSSADLGSAGECGSRSRSPGAGGSAAVRVVPETRSFSALLLSALCLPFLYSGPRCALSFGLQPPLTPASAVLARIWVPPAPSSPPRWDHVYPIHPLLPRPPPCLSFRRRLLLCPCSFASFSLSCFP